MRRKNFIVRIVTKAGVIIESTPRATFGEAKRWAKHLIEDCPNMVEPGIFSIKIIHLPTHTFVAGHYNFSKKELFVWSPYY